MNKKITLLVLALFVIGLMSCQLIPQSLTNLKNLSNGEDSSSNTSASDQPAVINQYVVPEGSIATTDAILSSIYDRVNSGVVSIISTLSQGTAYGTGFVYDVEGHILTNYHVIEDAETVEVDFPDGLKVYGDVIGIDIDSDIAVVKVQVDASELTPLSLGDSDALKVGQMVVAIGNPLEQLNTMTLGIVSAKGRVLDSMRTTDQSTFTAGDVIQTDAAINSGNSGGPLFNLNGEVIGINYRIQTASSYYSTESGNIGIGYAVSSNIVKKVVPSLITNGSYDYPFMGISCNSVDFPLPYWEALGIDRTSGAYVMEVTAGGPADQAGLLAGDELTSIRNLNAGGDLIIAVNGEPVKIYGDLINYIFKNNVPGDKIVLTILRNGEEKEVTLTLGKRP